MILWLKMIPGLDYYQEVLTEEEEQYLLSCIDKQPWCTDLARRTQHYGYKYDYKTRELFPAELFPVWCRDLINTLIEIDIIPSYPDQMIINEYQPGQGITKHIDSNVFANQIISVSLGSSCEMVFQQGNVENKMILEPRSVLSFQDQARYQWYHSIPARKSDNINGINTPRTRRVSLTFRYL